MTKREFQANRAKCVEKTAVDNVYPSRSMAAQVARRFRFQRGRKVEPYLCPVCQKWHVGRERARKKKWAE